MFTPDLIKSLGMAPSSQGDVVEKIAHSIHNRANGGSLKLRRFVRHARAGVTQVISAEDAKYLSNEVNYLWRRKYGSLPNFSLGSTATSANPKLMSEPSESSNHAKPKPMAAGTPPLRATGRKDDLGTWMSYLLQYQHRAPNERIRSLARDELMYLLKIEAGGAIKGNWVNNKLVGGYQNEYCGPLQLGQPFWNTGVALLRRAGINLPGLRTYGSPAALIAATKRGEAAADPALAIPLWIFTISLDMNQFRWIANKLPVQDIQKLVYALHNLGAGHFRNLLYWFGLGKPGNKSQLSTAYAVAFQSNRGDGYGDAIRNHASLIASLGGKATPTAVLRKAWGYGGPDTRARLRKAGFTG